MLVQDGTIRPFGPSVPGGICNAISRRPVSFAAGLAARPAAQGVLPRVADVDVDPAWTGLRREAREAGLKCCWAVTIAGADSVPLGVLVIFSPRHRAPDANERSVLETAARLATIGVEHHLTTRQLAHLVRHDPLTGLPNRILFEDRLHHSLATARRSGRPLALLALDLNRFKQVNDTLGHHAGDALLQQFAQRVKASLRESDTLARVGGDEFMLILPEIYGRDEAESTAQRVRQSLAAAPFPIAGRSLEVTSSIGIAIYPDDGQDALMLQRAADAAMYHVKEQGRASGSSSR
jgi:diguanylate cyclase (GGDEF)-like protein